MRPARRPPALRLEPLEDRFALSLVAGAEAYIASAPRLVVGSGVGGGEVRVYDVSRTAGAGAPSELLRLMPFGAGYTGGVNVATADLTGDGVPDVVAGMASGGSKVAVLDGKTGAELQSFDAFESAFTGGVNVAVCRLDPAGGWDVVAAAAGGGGPHVMVFDATTGAVLRSFYAFAPGFTGGVSVAAGDVTGGGAEDLVVGAGPGGGPHVKVLDAATGAVLRSFYAFDPTFAGGVTVATTRADGPADLIVGTATLGQTVKEYSGPTGGELGTFAAYAGAPVGVRVASADFYSGFDTPTFPPIVTGPGPGGGPDVKFFGWSPFGSADRSFYAFDPDMGDGVSVAAAPVAYGFRAAAPAADGSAPADGSSD